MRVTGRPAAIGNRALPSIIGPASALFRPQKSQRVGEIEDELASVVVKVQTPHATRETEAQSSCEEASFSTLFFVHGRHPASLRPSFDNASLLGVWTESLDVRRGRIHAHSLAWKPVLIRRHLADTPIGISLAGRTDHSIRGHEDGHVNKAKRKRKWVRREPISKALRDTIHNQGLTAYATAKQAGVSVDAVQRFLNAERGLNLATVDKLADALDLTLCPNESAN
jgi:hypothetical protein